MMSSKRINPTATARLKQDYMRIMRDPVPYVQAVPLPSNILEWHYIVTGPPNTPYEGGIYHGKLVFPREFPFKPPSIYMITPNGRFKCNTRLCLSISDFHPDTWNPAWSVSTILTGLLSFMLEKSPTLGSIETSAYTLEKSPTLGSIETSAYTKRQLAAQSGQFNLNNKLFCELFPEVAQDIRNELHQREEEMKRSMDTAAHTQASHPDIESTVPKHKPQAMMPHNQGFLGSALTNVFVILGFAAFAFTVKYVLRNVVD